MKTKPKKVGKESYKASIKFFGKEYTSKGATLKEVLEKLDVGRAGKGSSVLTVSKGQKSKSVIFPAGLTFRLFSASPLMRMIAIKQASMKFDL